MPSSDTPTYTMFINGEDVPAQSGKTYDSFDPFTSEVWAAHADADASDVDIAVAAAKAALEEGDWSTMSGHERAQLMFRLADLIEENAERLGQLETRDNGKLVKETTVQIKFAARGYRFFGGLADKLTGDLIPIDNRDVLDYTVQMPMGVCAMLVAWNSPVQLLANKLAPALASGNVAIIKPSEFASASVVEFGRLTREAGFPPGVVNVITGYGPTTGQALTKHRDVDLVSLTGGVETGRAVVRGTAENLAKVVLELGGKSPNIIFADANIDKALSGALAGIFGASGQTCIAGSRLFVQESIYDTFVPRLVEMAKEIRLGSPLDDATQMGPLANINHYERVVDIIEKAKADGAELLTGGGKPNGLEGLFVEPTIFADPDHTLPITHNEVFGPLLVVVPFKDEDHAIALANDTDFGLAAGVWTQDLSTALRMTRGIRAGTVWVNTYRAVSVAAPFGGFKLSGIGRERGMAGLREYMQTKNVMIDFSDSTRDPFVVKT